MKQINTENIIIKLNNVIEMEVMTPDRAGTAYHRINNKDSMNRGQCPFHKKM